MFSRLFTLVGFSLCTCVLGSTVSLAAQKNPFSLEGLIVTTSPTLRRASEVSVNVTVLDGTRLRAEGVATPGDIVARTILSAPLSGRLKFAATFRQHLDYTSTNHLRAISS